MCFYFDPRILICPCCKRRSHTFFMHSLTHFQAMAFGGEELEEEELDASRVVRCPTCKQVFWVSDAEQIEVGEGYDPDELDYPLFETLTVSELLEALEDGIARTEGEERDLRRQVWWQAAISRESVMMSSACGGMVLVAWTAFAGVVLGAAALNLLHPPILVAALALLVSTPFLMAGVGILNESRAVLRERAERAELMATDTWRRSLSRLCALLDADMPGERLEKAEAYRQLGRFQRASSLLERPLPEHLAARAERIRNLARARDPQPTLDILKGLGWSSSL